MTEARKRGRPRVDARLDDWSEVQDKRERKRIQDRLAQRLRRDRITSRTCTDDSKAGGSSTSLGGNIHSALVLASHENSQYRSPSSVSSPCATSKSSSEGSPQSSFHDQVVPSSSLHRRDSLDEIDAASGMTRDNYLLGLSAWPIFAALRQHGLMQGIIPANCHDEVISPLQPLSLPEALRPTPLQLVLSHRRWIDRFPFPRLRDNLIVLKDFINLDEFIRDLFSIAGLRFRSESKRATWDPASWKIEPEFAIKWGYLFN